jgi:hypothetical protein
MIDYLAQLLYLVLGHFALSEWVVLDQLWDGLLLEGAQLCVGLHCHCQVY